MNQQQFAKWLEDLKRAWEERDPSLLQGILNDELNYYEVPSEKPYTTKESVIKLWEDVPQSQQNIQFNYNILYTNENQGFAHWTASFERIAKNIKAHLDGIFIVTLNEKGLCTEFRQWWYSKEEKV